MKLKTAKGETILISKIDADLAEYTWRVGNKGYAYRHGNRKENGKRKDTYLHQIILFRMNNIDELPDDLIPDHKNRNKFDNRRSNLRLCTKQQNAWNQPARRKGHFKGIHRMSSGNFHTVIAVDGKNKNLGSYSKPDYAAFAYDEAARKLHGEFACLNFPEFTAEQKKQFRKKLVLDKRTVRKRKKAKNKYVGISGEGTSWIAIYKGKNLGSYHTAKLAALVRDECADRDGAPLNFPKLNSSRRRKKIKKGIFEKKVAKLKRLAEKHNTSLKTIAKIKYKLKNDWHEGIVKELSEQYNLKYWLVSEIRRGRVFANVIPTP